MFKISVSTTFDAAHFLKDYDGKCANLHGHTWRVEAEVEGQTTNDLGLLIDFGMIKDYLKEITSRLDHKLLNDVLPVNPTAENIARYIYQELKPKLMVYPEIKLCAIKVWESPNNSATFME
ncbi:6-carboxytetrahydropterin synthase QueD [Carboxydothermus pertinax]|uniref:6-carboxy-5,6,7,8-tetrahydropterin synthase n=1 Tax=Carboxydothermus pertinax TaxID=870242 RepID=A0A1L8CUD2_9THEO|nr:6-carboxytetrahydropterin synthase QueD [Carboxydothermus pertinax]GAV22518.1 6-pyruvoyl tetrahydrobiopterin synthase [Carboxydothermus pertinax]